MWILIIYVVGSSCMTLDHIEFHSKQNCEIAAKEMKTIWNRDNKIICVEK